MGDPKKYPRSSSFFLAFAPSYLFMALHLVFRKKMSSWRDKPSKPPALAAKITALVFLVFIMAFPFIMPLDFF